MHAQGHNGQITIEGDWLVITRKGLGRIGHSAGDRRIPLASITAVQMRPAKALTNGFIRFTVPGSPELRGGLKNAGSDENAVLFTKKQQVEFEAVRQIIERYIARRNGMGMGMGMGQPAPATPVGQDIAAQLAQLNQLHQTGALSDAEYAAAKARLIGG